jgi:hypothetical protein
MTGLGMTSNRRRLPQRRASIAVGLVHHGHHFRMQAGHFARSRREPPAR